MRPQRICLICECEAGLDAGLGLLAAELAQAGVIYEKIAQVDRPIEFVVAEKGAAGLRPGDALVALWDGGGSCGFLATWGAGAGAAGAGCPVYAICPGAGNAARLADACAEGGLQYCGALLVPNLRKAAVLTRSPRMGFARRQVSEAADRLLYAARTGEVFQTQTARFRTLRG